MDWILNNRFLYHVTTKEAVEKILNEGLSPNKIQGYFGEGGGFICLTCNKHIDNYLDQQRTEILQIPLSSLNIENFCLDVSHTLYNGLKPSFSDNHILQYMFEEYGTVGYSDHISKDMINLIDRSDIE